jgi:hypothetical protein
MSLAFTAVAISSLFFREISDKLLMLSAASFLSALVFLDNWLDDLPPV